ncbi:TPA: translation elongation factor Ts [Candidatus Uhrbacteria bacterium]|nr:MAG: Elongation factor Ts [Parcubacteria group bacterium GW2011_GWA2_53_21]OGL71788.1 MAG: translation elongation factor Ts [Candidatus Uhrbacteria bacterium RIFCSPHIGHO2_02_FULL_54_11]HBL39509.1 translation elongation factor Ts [Candidatus Uhrbacteria bacterium]
MPIDAKTVAMLREMTGAGMMDAKKALEEVGGDLEKAAEELRKKGVTKAAKKSDRATSEGRVHAYIHATGKVGVLVEVLCETDFVARNENFIAFCNDLAMHIAASDPSYLTREDVPEEIVAKEKELVASALKEEGKPEAMIEKISQGKMDKWYGEVVLMEQPFIKDEEKTIQELLTEQIVTIGENMAIRRFARFAI